MEIVLDGDGGHIRHRRMLLCVQAGLGVQQGHSRHNSRHHDGAPHRRLLSIRHHLQHQPGTFTSGFGFEHISLEKVACKLIEVKHINYLDST